MKKILTVAFCLLLCASMLSCAKKEEAPKQEAPTAMGNIIEIASADARFSTLAKAIEAAGLVETLKEKGPFTVFAPTEEAFAALPPGTLDGLLSNVPQLKNVLLHHVVSGKIMAADIVNLTSAATVLGPVLTIAVTPDGTVTVNGVAVTTTDIEAKNGVIHAIDAVILPPPPAKPAM